MAARACIRDVGRAMSYPYSEVDRIAKMIPTMLNITIDKALELNPELSTAYEEEPRTKDLIDVARALEGLPRHTSTHAAGVVIASNPLVTYVPLQKNEGNIVTQFTMGTLEELGLLKMDFLGLRTLTVMTDAVNMIKENKGIEIDLDNIDFDDKNVYKMLGEGKTVGAFQLESPGMTSFMKDLKPDSFEDIIAGISLYRPGPMAEIPRYVENKRHPESIEYETPQLEHILKVTYGVMIYQEEVMQIVRDLAGYSLGRADLVRRAMSKKKHKVMEEERKNFIYGIVDEGGNVEVPGCLRNGISEEAANKIFNQMMDFASYAFNKSHAAAYAVVAYQTAYLMRYYPTEFIAAMLNSVMGNNEKVAYYIRFGNERSIEILPPDINESYTKFTVQGEQIRFGIAAIKNVGVNVIENIVKVRSEKGRFKDLLDFCNKVDLGVINKRAVESLIKAGALDSFGVYRSRLLAVHEKVMDGINGDKKKNIQGQINLFSDFGEQEIDPIDIKYPEIKEFDKKHLLFMEKEMTGLYLSGHPLEEYKEVLKNKTSINIGEIISSGSLEESNEGVLLQDKKVKDGQKVKIGGIITSVNKKLTKNNDMMAFVEIEDLYGIIELVVFPKVFNKLRHLINEDAMILVSGRVSIREDEAPKILCEDISDLSGSSIEKIYIRIDTEEELQPSLKQLKIICPSYKGSIPIYLYVKSINKAFVMNKELWVNGEKELLTFLKNQFAIENVKVV